MKPLPTDNLIAIIFPVFDGSGLGFDLMAKTVIDTEFTPVKAEPFCKRTEGRMEMGLEQAGIARDVKGYYMLANRNSNLQLAIPRKATPDAPFTVSFWRYGQDSADRMVITNTGGAG